MKYMWIFTAASAFAFSLLPSGWESGDGGQSLSGVLMGIGQGLSGL